MLDQAVILAGGRGTRLGDLTLQTPKPLLSVGGRPFLEYIVWNLSRFGMKNLLLSVGFLADRIIEHFGNGSRYGVAFDYSVEQEPLHTGGALRLAADRLGDTFLVVNGDTLFDLNYLDLALVPRRSSALVGIALRKVPERQRYGNVRLEGELVRGFSEKARGGPGLVNGGVYVMKRRVVDQIPAGSSLERDLFPALASDGQLAGKAYDGFFVDIGVPESLSHARRVIPRWERRPAVFFDRDGVLNVDQDHVHDPNSFVWMEGAPEAVKWLNDRGYLVIVVTNQSVIARGYSSEDAFRSFSHWINEQLRARGAHIDATYYCPHHPSEGIGPYRTVCDCRKPAPGLIRRALAEWNIDLERSTVVGDNESDLQAAKDAGLSSLLFEGGNLLHFIETSIPRDAMAALQAR